MENNIYGHLILGIVIPEHTVELGQQVDSSCLKADRLPNDQYMVVHGQVVRTCHDIVLATEQGMLLVARQQHPEAGSIWPVGGELKRGIPMRDSLRMKVREESGLEMFDEVFLGVERTMFGTAPFAHGRGTDTVNLMYFANASGEVRLDENHEKPRWYTPTEIGNSWNEFHPYVQNILSLSIPHYRHRFG